MKFGAKPPRKFVEIGATDYINRNVLCKRKTCAPTTVSMMK
ncbi:hypothetical protein OESDEN_23682 [Oesophagostomum dentatum]|uniref:Uncharacterized protein n=1 Tax=Oesophagostomum dentatum TaxID=61180 RepID=A0A0B1RUF2_OESDE|nr:hypothetical protein OESDEN_23682 [Oesophagostomum dentatum]